MVSRRSDVSYTQTSQGASSGPSGEPPPTRRVSLSGVVSSAGAAPASWADRQKAQSQAVIFDMMSLSVSFGSAPSAQGSGGLSSPACFPIAGLLPSTSLSLVAVLLRFPPTPVRDAP